jgi:hypothetical protein
VSLEDEEHRARVVELGKQIAEQDAELLARLAEGEPEPEPESQGTGWCAPSP